MLDKCFVESVSISANSNPHLEYFAENNILKTRLGQQ